jgi:tripartite-type tricarboxylate transporter receptor subunit TctC
VIQSIPKSAWALIVQAAAVCLGVAMGSSAMAQAGFPTKPVGIVTPFSAGSGPGAVARVLGEGLAKQWGQRVVIDNRPGGGGFIAIEVARGLPADGYTLLLLDSERLGACPTCISSAASGPWRHLNPLPRCFERRSWSLSPPDCLGSP